jgi:TolB-like protein
MLKSLLIRKGPLFFCLLALIPSLSVADVPTVAVMDFVNNTGSEGLAYLSDSLPEALSASLANIEGIQVVERVQLDRVLEEIELELSDLFDEEAASNVGRMAKADVLLLGSYSGDPEEVILSLKAVEIETATVLTGKVLLVPLGELCDQDHQAAWVIGNIIAGREVGSLSVSTAPAGAVVYIDGLLVGKSPLVEYKLTVGTHRVKAVLSGYLDKEVTVVIDPNELEVWKPVLIEQQTKNRSEFGLSVVGLIPLKGEIKPAPLFAGFFGHTFNHLLVSGEFGFSRIDQSETIDSPFGGIEQARWYNYLNATVSLSYIFRDSSRFFRPYAGGFVGWGRLVDFRKNRAFEDDKETLQEQHLLSLGLKVGTLFAPYTKFGVYLEGRLGYSPLEIIRDEYESQGLLGDLLKKESNFRFNTVSIGGGVKFFL